MCIYIYNIYIYISIYIYIYIYNVYTCSTSLIWHGSGRRIIIIIVVVIIVIIVIIKIWQLCEALTWSQNKSNEFRHWGKRYALAFWEV